MDLDLGFFPRYFHIKIVSLFLSSLWCYMFGYLIASGFITLKIVKRHYCR